MKHLSEKMQFPGFLFPQVKALPGETGSASALPVSPGSVANTTLCDPGDIIGNSL